MCVGAPLRAVGSELDGEGRALDRRRDRLDPGDLVLDARRRRAELRLDRAARRLGQLRQDAVGRAIDQRIAVAHEDGERHADADLRRRAGDFARLLDGRHRALKPGVMRHDRPGPGAGRPPERGERAEIGVDRRHRRAAQQPGLERLCRRAEGRRRERPCVIVRIDERRHGEAPPRRRAGRGRDRRDAAVLDRDVDRRTGRRPVGRQHNDAGQPVAHDAGSSMTLIWAATMRQPSGKRTQVCICRPIFPGALSRRNRVAAMAQSGP